MLQFVSSLGGSGVSLTHPVLESVSLTHPVLECVLSFVGRGVSLTGPVLVCVSSRVGGEFLLHAP